MPASLRLLLIVASVLFLIFIIHKIYHAQLRLIDGFVWLLFSVFLIVISAFPKIIYALCSLIGIQSPINLVFLIIIFLQLIMGFFQSIKISHLESRINDLAQEVALRDREFLGIETRDDREHKNNMEKPGKVQNDAEGRS